jgi:xanthine dehydrogenase accessory factor
MLAEQGLSQTHIARLHAPVGLPLGGKNPPEIALSILAEIVRVHHQRGVR